MRLKYAKRLDFILLLLFNIIRVYSYSQENQPATINLGDSAPPLRVSEWLKGKPVQRFEKGHVYVVEFWATWCKPCVAMMPHLSALARQYKNRVTILGVDVYERKTTPIEKVKAFVDSMGSRMHYTAAIEDSNTVKDWIESTGEENSGIPKTFVVDAEGRLAWIGHPKDLAEVLHRVVSGTWDVKDALAHRNDNKHLEKMDRWAMDTLLTYMTNPKKRDSALIIINELTKKEPNLKYTPLIGSNTFSLLLETNPAQAYDFGKVLLVTPTYEEPDYRGIASGIEWASKKVNILTEIYLLGAEAYRANIDAYAQFGNINIPKNYSGMAEMYFQAKNKVKAIEAIKKAIEEAKIEKGYPKKDMVAFEYQLQKYMKME